MAIILAIIKVQQLTITYFAQVNIIRLSRLFSNCWTNPVQNLAEIAQTV
jgi:hypothetical protein